jgi:hypothetical protein
MNGATTTRFKARARAVHVRSSQPDEQAAWGWQRSGGDRRSEPCTSQTARSASIFEYTKATGRRDAGP